MTFIEDIWSVIRKTLKRSPFHLKAGNLLLVSYFLTTPQKKLDLRHYAIFYSSYLSAIWMRGKRVTALTFIFHRSLMNEMHVRITTCEASTKEAVAPKPTDILVSNKLYVCSQACETTVHLGYWKVSVFSILYLKRSLPPKNT